MPNKRDIVKKVANISNNVDVEEVKTLLENIELPDILKDLEIFEKIKPILDNIIEVLKINKDKAAASIIAIPVCFEYGVIGKVG